MPRKAYYDFFGDFRVVFKPRDPIFAPGRSHKPLVDPKKWGKMAKIGSLGLKTTLKSPKKS